MSDDAKQLKAILARVPVRLRRRTDGVGKWKDARTLEAEHTLELARLEAEAIYGKPKSPKV